ncbi:GTP pyrophosphokinase YjbM [Acinetobacter venetianus]|uniref:GTP pyrophosphokinase YjbM n=1 Tax=Acinetobacter venetianus TaxID=52133 RepID=A0A150I1W2_9GAMM|nr:GTP pyrophosphokinase [Acinetobacter venetianus]KXZ73230.1 GTP pyrophosphokinase YjbM [Acinetobacter venetianus]
MKDEKNLTKEELKERAIRFYNRYGSDLEQISELLKIRLTQLSLAYTLKNNLPPEAIKISTRVKTLSSFLKKLEKKGWPQFYYPTELVQDLIGARVVCWFVDDCVGIKSFISSSKHLQIKGEVEDYITNPKPSGYRSIHLLAEVGYDSVQRKNSDVIIMSEDMVCEIQIRTKLQDAWGDVTHEFHYKAKNAGVDNKVYEQILSQISDRLANEDKSMLTLRDAYQELADDKTKNSTREGFRDE